MAAHMLSTGLIASAFECLLPADQGALRGTCKRAVAAFDAAVQRGAPLGLAATTSANIAGRVATAADVEALVDAGAGSSGESPGRRTDASTEPVRWFPAREARIAAGAGANLPAPVAVAAHARVLRAARAADRSGPNTPGLLQGCTARVVRLAGVSRAAFGDRLLYGAAAEIVAIVDDEEAARCTEARLRMSAELDAGRELQRQRTEASAASCSVMAVDEDDAASEMPRAASSSNMGAVAGSASWADGGRELSSVSAYDQLVAEADARAAAALERAVATLGDDCIANCKCLVEVLVAPGPHLRSVGDTWLSGCKALRRVHVRGAPALKTVGARWLAHSPGLETFDVTRPPRGGAPPSLQALESVGPWWLHGCGALTGLRLSGDAFPSLRTVDAEWLSGCRKLETLAVERLPRLETIGSSFAARCVALVQFTVAELPRLRVVGASWGDGCAALTDFDLRAVPRLTQVGPRWLLSCTALVDVALGDLPGLQRVGSEWLSCCSALRSVRVSGLPSLDEVGPSWLFLSRALESATFAGAPKLRRVGPGWLDECPRLQRFDASGLHQLRELGHSFLGASRELREALPPPRIGLPPHVEDAMRRSAIAGGAGR